MANTKATPVSNKFSLGGELVLGALVAELVGTFILTFAVLNTQGNPIIAAVTVIVVVLMIAKLSGGHINPAVTIGLLSTRRISWVRALGYIVAQFLGAMLAVVLMNQLLAGAAADPTGQTSNKVFTLFSEVRPPGEWKPILGELVGAILLGFGVGAAVLGKKEGFEAAFTVGGALLLGLVAAIAASYGVLNPAVALGAGGYSAGGWWSIAAYGLAPVIGASAGTWLYKLLQSDVGQNAKK